MIWKTHDFDPLLRFGGSSPPAPQPVPPAPTLTDPSIAAASQAQATAAAQAMGRGATILTSGLGDQTAPTLGRKTLLGG